MVQPQSFNAIKILLTGLNGGLTPRREDIPLNIEDNSDFDAVYNKRLNTFFAGYGDLYQAVQNQDKAAIKTALTRAKIATLSLTSFFTALEDDCISLLSHLDDGHPGQDALAEPHAGGKGVMV